MFWELWFKAGSALTALLGKSWAGAGNTLCSVCPGTGGQQQRQQVFFSCARKVWNCCARLARGGRCQAVGGPEGAHSPPRGVEVHGTEGAAGLGPADHQCGLGSVER